MPAGATQQQLAEVPACSSYQRLDLFACQQLRALPDLDGWTSLAWINLTGADSRLHSTSIKPGG